MLEQRRTAQYSPLPSRKTSHGYRPEIDGLRALAVVSVILFHAGVPPFSGGFVGVDVFFVISGYLITKIILQEAGKGEFTYWGFYERRARRILPALFLVTACCFPFALAWMPPADYLDFSWSAASLSIFVSNFYFWLQGNYFAPDSDLRPLLHTWSLGIEEQFYLIAPTLILLSLKMGKKALLWALVATAAAGAVLAHFVSAHDANTAFYLPHTRLWELEVGAICAVVEVIYGRRERWIPAAAGIALIVLSIFAFDKTTPFPSLYALLPTVGAGLFIFFASPNKAAGKLFSLAPIVFLGLLSYSAYLWHQPLLVFARLRSLDGLSFSTVVA